MPFPSHSLILSNESYPLLQRSEELPYTHPMPIRSFLTTVADGITYVITGGGEGLIKIWKFDQPSGQFEVLSTLEGHIRDVTCLYLFGTYEKSHFLPEPL